jgi:hypothetical protein
LRGGSKCLCHPNQTIVGGSIAAARE